MGRMRRRIVGERNESEVGPPQSVNVEAAQRLVLYSHDGTPLTRQIGFRMQTVGTCPPLSDNTSKRKPKKGR